MSISLEQARVLDAVAKLGSVAGAAKHMRKSHTALLYALDNLEEAVGFPVVDRAGYRIRLTSGGERVLLGCRRMLAAEDEILAVGRQYGDGWEPHLHLVFDGLMPVEPLIDGVMRLRRKKTPTRVQLTSEFLGSVEEKYHASQADWMISLLPIEGHFGERITLPPLRAQLLCHRDHPLAKGGAKGRNLEDFPFLTVRGSDLRLQMPTSGLMGLETFTLGDFHAKRTALMRGVGFGWMPDHLVEGELKRGVLVPVKWSGGAEHRFRPVLFGRTRRMSESKAAQIFFEGVDEVPSQKSGKPNNEFGEA